MTTSASCLPVEIDMPRLNQMPRKSPNLEPGIILTAPPRRCANKSFEMCMQALPKAPTIVELVHLMPASLGLIWLMVWTTSRASADGLFSAPGLLRQGVAAVDLGGFWHVAFMGGLPFLASLFLYSTSIRLGVLLECPDKSRACDKPNYIDAQRHQALVDEGTPSTTCEKAQMCLIAASGLICTFQYTSRLRFFVWAPPLPSLLFEILLYVFFVTAIPVALVCLRFVRMGILKEQGGNALETCTYIQTLMLGLVCLSASLLSYLTLFVSGSPPFTTAMTGLEQHNPCALAANASVLDALKCVPSTSVYDAPGSLTCASSGASDFFGDYLTTVDACTAARAYVPITCRAYACFLLWLNLAILAVASMAKAGLAAGRRSRRFPLLSWAAFNMLYGLVGLLAPLYMSMLIVPDDILRTSWISQIVSRVYALVINLFLVSCAVLLISAEAIMARIDPLLTGGDLDIALPNGERRRVREELFRLLCDAFKAEVRNDGGFSDASRFSGEPSDLILGKPAEAALGINHYMRVDMASFAMPPYARGVAAITAEIEASGTPEDHECLDYVLNQRAGESELVFANGNRKRDCDGQGNLLTSRLDPVSGRGMAFADFVQHPHSRIARLQEPHVLALRLYTTAAFRSLNVPLRDTRAERPPHPFPITVNYIREGISQLRAAAQQHYSDDTLDLWRGLKNLKAGAEFQRHGGTELAPMSTTTDLSIAVAYSISSRSLLLKLRTNSFMGRGADLSYLSAFPGESEILVSTRRLERCAIACPWLQLISCARIETILVVGSSLHSLI